ncbi:hypothetical protein L915_08989 [Phytophthora nicotianae]|uniref:Uncharacterized protein n=1 Tax=Phytophthora nicotianae TaxID=4792 RepID=W2GTT7_PHYNI|nr:hypothetical protein L915_08989 [Phytophthora nicotianae]ETM30608.1 hypothetical protein L914_21716 [Phytophthora nicotianae]
MHSDELHLPRTASQDLFGGSPGAICHSFELLTPPRYRTP